MPELLQNHTQRKQNKSLFVRGNGIMDNSIISFYECNRGLSIRRPSWRSIYLSRRPDISKSMYFLVLEPTYWSPERRNFSANLLKLALEETNIWSPVRNFAAMTEAASRTDWLPRSRLAVCPSM